MSVLVRNAWRTLARAGCVHHPTPLRTCNVPSNSYSSPRHTGITESQTSLSKPQDLVTSNLASASTASELLATLQRLLPALSHKHLVQALRTLFEMHKKDQVTNDIVKDPTFEILCQNIKKQSRLLDIHEIIEVTKVLSHFSVPVNSMVVQTMLQLIRCNINELNIRQIIFIDFLLGKFDTKNHLVDALKLALPLVFQIHLPLELDRQDLVLLKDMLFYACNHELPDKCINNIITSLLVTDQEINVQTAKSMVWSLCQINCTQEVYPTRAQLLRLSFQVLSDNILELPYGDVLWTMAKLKSRILEKHPEYYNETLMDSIADYLVLKNIPFEKTLLVARILSRIAHTHLGLMEQLCQLASSDPTCLSEAPPNMILSFVNCLSNNNYTPHQEVWEKLRSQISQNAIMESKNLALPWSKFCLELASLGHYEDRLLNMVFSNEFLDKYLDRENNTLDFIQLLMLHEAVQTFHNPHLGLPPERLSAARAAYPVHAVTDQVADTLVTGLPSADCLATNVLLSNGFVADILICIQSGTPIALPQFPKTRLGKISIEKLNVPRDCVTVCILCFTQNCYSINSNRLRGTFQLLLDLIERQGYIAVPINVTMWMNMPHHERTSYVLREVDYKCGKSVKTNAT